MADKEKKRRSGRSPQGAIGFPSDSKSAKPTHKLPFEHDPNPELHSPLIPLFWLLVPLIACIIYGVATR